MSVLWSTFKCIHSSLITYTRHKCTYYTGEDTQRERTHRRRGHTEERTHRRRAHTGKENTQGEDTQMERTRRRNVILITKKSLISTLRVGAVAGLLVERLFERHLVVSGNHDHLQRKYKKKYVQLPIMGFSCLAEKLELLFAIKRTYSR